MPSDHEALLDWYNFDFILFYLSQGEIDLTNVELEFGNYESQLANLAKSYQPYAQSVKTLLEPHAYVHNKSKLLTDSSEWEQRQWGKLKGKGV